MRRQSKLPQNDSSTSDSESYSDSDNSLEHQTASDVINSFLNPPSQTVQRANISKSRKASDVINSFLHKQNNKIVAQANDSQFNSALDVINSYLRRDEFLGTRSSTRNSTVPRHRRKVNDGDLLTSASGSDSEFKSQKRVREESSATSDSDTTDDSNLAKRRRLENSSTSITIKEPVGINSDVSKQLGHQTVATVDGNGKHTNVIPSNGSPSNKESRQGPTVRTTRTTLRKKAINRRESSNAPEMLKVSFTREVFSRKMRTRRVVEQHTVIKDHEIPKEKYDRAVNMLNATECRYDETPVDYNSLPKTSFDVRRCCNSRRHAEATHDTVKLGTSVPVSLTRIVIELDNCLKKENWQQMAELIYFGCGLMKTDQSRRAIGTAFFTYALLLLILDSTPESISTLHGKRDAITKFLVALGSEPEENEEFLMELNLLMDESDDLLVIKSEVE